MHNETSATIERMDADAPGQDRTCLNAPGRASTRPGAPGSFWELPGSSWEHLGAPWERLGAPGRSRTSPDVPERARTCFNAPGSSREKKQETGFLRHLMVFTHQSTTSSFQK
jgi:hypothetical protein